MASANYFPHLLSIGVAACLLGCGKKQPAANASPPAQPNASALSSAPNSPVALPAASATPAVPAASPDAQVTARSLDYLKGQIARKNWGQARLALSQLEARPLTPQQRQYMDSLKAQMPPAR